MKIYITAIYPGKEFLDKLEYPGDGLKRNRHGILYQRDVIMLALWRALKMAGQFRLAGKFDDLCYSYRSSPEERWSMRFVQIKHGLISEKDKITVKDLFDPHGKYYIPYT
jgi:hypothetical protein